MGKMTEQYEQPWTKVFELSAGTPLAMSGDGSETMDETVSGALGIEGLGNGGSYIW